MGDFLKIAESVNTLSKAEFTKAAVTIADPPFGVLLSKGDFLDNDGTFLVKTGSTFSMSQDLFNQAAQFFNQMTNERGAILVFMAVEQLPFWTIAFAFVGRKLANKTLHICQDTSVKPEQTKVCSLEKGL